MKAHRIPLAMTAVVALALATPMLASPADAHGGHGRKHRHKHIERVVVNPRPHHVVYVAPRVASGPSFSQLVLAGVIGGVHVAARFGDAPYSGYGYWDPYCDMRFGSLRAYRHHCDSHDHPYRLRVFAVAPGHSCDRRCDHDCDDRTWDRDHGRYNGTWESWHDQDEDDDWDR